MSLTNRTFAILGFCGIDFQSSVQNGMSTNSLESVRYGILKITQNRLESVLNQSSLTHLGDAIHGPSVYRVTWRI